MDRYYLRSRQIDYEPMSDVGEDDSRSESDDDGQSPYRHAYKHGSIDDFKCSLPRDQDGNFSLVVRTADAGRMDWYDLPQLDSVRWYDHGCVLRRDTIVGCRLPRDVNSGTGVMPVMILDIRLSHTTPLVAVAAFLSRAQARQELAPRRTRMPRWDDTLLASLTNRVEVYHWKSLMNADALSHHGYDIEGLADPDTILVLPNSGPNTSPCTWRWFDFDSGRPDCELAASFRRQRQIAADDKSCK